jgi:hypothetical protein
LAGAFLACSAQAENSNDGGNHPVRPTGGANSGVGGSTPGVTGGAFVSPQGGTPGNPQGGTPTAMGGGGAGGKAGGGTPGAQGGNRPTGGTTTTVGGSVTFTGGIANAGGAATGTGGAAMVTCEAAFAAGNDGFVKAKGAGATCWHGYAFAGKAGEGSTVDKTTFSTCGAGCMICAKGEVGASDSAVAFVGFNVAQSPGSSAAGSIAPTGTGLTVTFTKTGTFPLRVQIQGVGGDKDETKRWCYTVTTSPVTIPYAMFNTQCWEGGAGTAYAKEPIQAVQLLIPGSASATAATPYDACITGASDG